MCMLNTSFNSGLEEMDVNYESDDDADFTKMDMVNFITKV